MSRRKELERQLDTLHRQMGEAYDAGDMERWEALAQERRRVGEEYRALVDAS